MGSLPDNLDSVKRGRSGGLSFEERASMSEDRHLIEERISSDVVYRGSFFELRRDRVRLPDGREAGREYIAHPGAVMVVPIFDP